MRVFAIYCETIELRGIGSTIGRVTIVDRFKRMVLDEYIKPTAEVLNYRFLHSIAKKVNLMKGKELAVVAAKVGSLIDGCILVGYRLSLDLGILGLSHPSAYCKDLDEFQRLVMESSGNNMKMEMVGNCFLSSIQGEKNGGEDSADKANAYMELYLMLETNW